jgi:hypothetical protein
MLCKRFNKTKEYSFRSLLSWAANVVGMLLGNVLRAAIDSPVGGIVACGAALAGLCQAGLVEFFVVGSGMVIAAFVVGMVSNLFSARRW